MSTSKTDEDTQEISRITSRHRDILKLLERRQQHGHTAYAAVAATIDGVALLVWGTILRDAILEPPSAPSRAYLAFLAFAIVLAMAGSAGTFTWMIVIVNQRLASEQDRIKAYDDEQQIKKVTNAVVAALDKRDRQAKQEQWENLLGGTGTIGGGSGGSAGPVPQPRNGESGNVIPWRRAGGTQNRA